MITTERLQAAYKTVEDAAPGLAMGNDAASGYRILAHCALVGFKTLSPAKAKEFLEGWAKIVEDDLAAREVQ